MATASSSSTAIGAFCHRHATYFVEPLTAFEASEGSDLNVIQCYIILKQLAPDLAADLRIMLIPDAAVMVDEVARILIQQFKRQVEESRRR